MKGDGPDGGSDESLALHLPGRNSTGGRRTSKGTTSSISEDDFHSFPPSSSSRSSTASTVLPHDPRLQDHRHALFNSDENITVIIRGDHFSQRSISPDSVQDDASTIPDREVPGPIPPSQEARSQPVLMMPRPSYPHPNVNQLTQSLLTPSPPSTSSDETPEKTPRSSIYVIPGEAITSDDISPSSRHPISRPFSTSPQPYASVPQSQISATQNSEEETLRASPGQSEAGGDVVPELIDLYTDRGVGVPPLRRKSPITQSQLTSTALPPSKEIPEYDANNPPSSPSGVIYSSDPWFSDDIIYDRDEELAVIRILDTRILPFILLCLFVLSMDRTNHSNAISDNLPEDLGFDINTVNVGVVSKALGPARFIPILTFSWGVITIAHAFIRNRVDYLVVRSWIAITEAGVIPAILVYFGRFYKGNEFATRLAYLWSAQMIGSAVSGLSASGLLQLRGFFKLEGWRWLFLVDGIITLVLAIFIWFYLPRHVAHTAGGLRGKRPWFTERQVQISVTRVVRDDIAKRRLDKPVTWSDVADTFSDPKIWIHVLNTTIGLTPMTPLHTYFPLTIKNFNFNVFAANALTAPPHFIQAISTILLIRHSDKTRERGFHGALGTGWQLLGWLLLLFLPSSTHRVLKYFAAVVVASYPAVHPLNVAWMAENAGSIGKRTIATGLMSGFSAIHGTWGSQIYRADDLPNFRRGNAINLAFASTATCLWFAQKYYYRSLNRRYANKYAGLSPEGRRQEEALQASRGNSSVLFRFVT
ncbi:hypothetical protein ONZ45_g17951 [Pleurotus djamor]|nr:hypothetical protein ONZ45_g17951 [Pleurotus djamor]